MIVSKHSEEMYFKLDWVQLDLTSNSTLQVLLKCGDYSLISPNIHRVKHKCPGKNMNTESSMHALHRTCLQLIPDLISMSGFMVYFKGCIN